MTKHRLKKSKQKRQKQHKTAQSQKFPKNNRPIPEAPNEAVEKVVPPLHIRFTEYCIFLVSYSKNKAKSIHHGVLTHKLHVLIGLWFFVLVLGVVATTKNVLDRVEERKRIQAERVAVERQVAYWQDVVEKYQNYRDGYIQLAALEHQLGNNEKAKEYIKKALDLDPNFEPAQELQQLLQQ